VPLQQREIDNMLPDRVREAVNHYASQAYDPKSIKTWSSGWASWLQYCEECNADSLGDYSDRELDELLAGFKAMLAQGHYGRGKHKSANTIESYSEAVKHFRAQHFNKRLSHEVTRGIKKEHGVNERKKMTVTLDMMCEMTVQADSNKLNELRNIVAYQQLGQGVLRSCAAVCLTVQEWETGNTMMVDDVKIDTDKYTVGFGLKRNKNDQFREAVGDDGRDWVWVSGTKGSVLDVVPITQLYFAKMKFEELSAFQKSTTPFYQEILFNKPTGRPFTYARLLREFRNDLHRLRSTRFPKIVPDEWGMHAFRRFGACVCKLNGVPSDVIKILGKWRSASFEAYFVFTEDEIIDLQSTMLRGHAEHSSNLQSLKRTAPSSSATAAKPKARVKRPRGTCSRNSDRA
jgi:hypothetical protein